MVNVEFGEFLQPKTITPKVYKYLKRLAEDLEPYERRVILTFNSFPFNQFVNVNPDRCQYGALLPSHCIVPCIRFICDRRFHLLGTLFFYKEYWETNRIKFSKDMSECIKLYILALANINLRVVATVSPCIDIFTQAIQILSHIPYLEQHVGVICYNVGHVTDIYHLHDPTHIQCELVNLLQDYDFYFFLYGSQYYATKDHILESLRLDNKPLISRDLEAEALDQGETIGDYYLTMEIKESIGRHIRSGALPSEAIGTRLLIGNLRDMFHEFYTDSDAAQYKVITSQDLCQLVDFLDSIEMVRNKTPAAEYLSTPSRVDPRKSRMVRNLKDIDSYITKQKLGQTVPADDTQFQENVKNLEYNLYSDMCNSPDDLQKDSNVIFSTSSGRTLTADSSGIKKGKKKKNINIPSSVKKELIKARIAASGASKVTTPTKPTVPKSKGESSKVPTPAKTTVPKIKSEESKVTTPTKPTVPKSKGESSKVPTPAKTTVPKIKSEESKVLTPTKQTVSKSKGEASKAPTPAKTTVPKKKSEESKAPTPRKQTVYKSKDKESKAPTPTKQTVPESKSVPKKESTKSQIEFPSSSKKSSPNNQKNNLNTAIGEVSKLATPSEEKEGKSNIEPSNIENKNQKNADELNISSETKGKRRKKNKNRSVIPEDAVDAEPAIEKTKAGIEDIKSSKKEVQTKNDEQGQNSETIPYIDSEHSKPENKTSQDDKSKVITQQSSLDKSIGGQHSESSKSTGTTDSLSSADEIYHQEIAKLNKYNKDMDQIADHPKDKIMRIEDSSIENLNLPSTSSACRSPEELEISEALMMLSGQSEEFITDNQTKIDQGKVTSKKSDFDDLPDLVDDSDQEVDIIPVTVKEFESSLRIENDIIGETSINEQHYRNEEIDDSVQEVKTENETNFNDDKIKVFESEEVSKAGTSKQEPVSTLMGDSKPTRLKVEDIDETKTSVSEHNIEKDEDLISKLTVPKKEKRREVKTEYETNFNDDKNKVLDSKEVAKAGTSKEEPVMDDTKPTRLKDENLISKLPVFEKENKDHRYAIMATAKFVLPEIPDLTDELPDLIYDTDSDDSESAKLDKNKSSVDRSNNGRGDVSGGMPNIEDELAEIPELVGDLESTISSIEQNESIDSNVDKKQVRTDSYTDSTEQQQSTSFGAKDHIKHDDAKQSISQEDVIRIAKDILKNNADRLSAAEMSTGGVGLESSVQGDPYSSFICYPDQDDHTYAKGYRSGSSEETLYDTEEESSSEDNEPEELQLANKDKTADLSPFQSSDIRAYYSEDKSKINARLDKVEKLKFDDRATEVNLRIAELIASNSITVIEETASNVEIIRNDAIADLLEQERNLRIALGVQTCSELDSAADFKPEDLISKKSMDLLLDKYLTRDQAKDILGEQAEVDTASKLDSVVDCLRKTNVQSSEKIESSDNKISYGNVEPPKSKENLIKISWKDGDTVSIQKVDADSVKSCPKDPFKKTDLRDDSSVMDINESKKAKDAKIRIDHSTQTVGSSRNEGFVGDASECSATDEQVEPYIISLSVVDEISGSNKPNKDEKIPPKNEPNTASNKTAGNDNNQDEMQKTGAIKKTYKKKTKESKTVMKDFKSWINFKKFVNQFCQFIKHTARNYYLPCPAHEYLDKAVRECENFFIERSCIESIEEKEFWDEVVFKYMDLFRSILGEAVFRKPKVYNAIVKAINELDHLTVVPKGTKPKVEKLTNGQLLIKNLWIQNLWTMTELFANLRTIQSFDELAPDLIKTDHVRGVMRHVLKYANEPSTFVIENECIPVDIYESFDNLKPCGSVLLVE